MTHLIRSLEAVWARYTGLRQCTFMKLDLYPGVSDYCYFVRLRMLPGSARQGQEQPKEPTPSGY